MKKVFTTLLIVLALVPAMVFANGASETKTDENITLKFFGFKHGSEAGALPEIIAAYEAEHPNIKIEYEGINTESGYTTVVNTRLASDEQMDIFMLFGNVLDLIEGGFLEDLSDEPYAEKLSASLKPFLSADNKLYATYTNSAGLPILFSNMEILEECGVEIPTNWNEYLAACETIKNHGYLPMVAGNKNGWTGLVMTYGITNARLNNDGTIIEAEAALNDGSLKCGDMFLESFKEIEVLRDNGYFDKNIASGMMWSDEAFSSFANGEAAFMVGGSWQIAQLKKLENNDLKFMTSAFPGQDEGDPCGVLLPAIPIAINSSSKYIDEAKDFLRFLCEGENAKKWSESQSALSPFAGIEVELDEEFAPFIKVVASGNAAPYELQTIADNGMQPTIMSAAQLVMSGEWSAERAAEEITKVYERQQLLK